MPNILDPVTNFAVGQLSGGISAGATSLTLGNNASRFPDPSTLGAYDAVLWDSSEYANASLDPDAEIVRVTAKSGSIFTITRAQQGTTATAKNTAGHTYSFSLPTTAKMFQDIELYFSPKASPTFSGIVTFSGLTASTVPYLNASKELTSSAVTPTELGYLSGVTSAIQTQLNAKAPLASPTFTGTATFGGQVVLTGDIAIGTASANAYIQHNNTNGLVLQGAGTTNDMLVVNSAGSNVFRIPIAGTNVRFYSAPEPSSNDLCAIGSASRSFSDFFIASGGVINWDNGNYTVTHSTGNLTFSGTLTVTATKQIVSSASIYNYVDVSNASGNLVASSRGSIFLDVDADNTSTANTLFVRFNSTTYTGIFEEDGALTLGGTAKSGTGALYSGKIQVGTTAPTASSGAALTVNTDITTGSAGSASLMIQGASNKERIAIFSAGGAGGGGTPLINMFSFRGTLASPTATQNGDMLSGVSGGGYKATGYSGNNYAFIQYATENWTDSATGCYTAFFTVPNGSTSLTGRLLIDHDGSVTLGAGFGAGTGALYAGAGTFTGLLTTVASATGSAGLRIPHGTAPSSPTNGDIWTTTAGAFIRINGVTKTFTLT